MLRQQWRNASPAERQNMVQKQRARRAQRRAMQGPPPAARRP
jgi:hypothetical protein